MIELQERSCGIVLSVKAQPGARRNGIVGEHAGALKVAVSAAPEHGKATAAIVELLAEALEIPRSNIQLISGATRRKKQFLICGIALSEFERRMIAALHGIEEARSKT
jgi:uncharacterized protein (TIGR00251 family)